MEPVRGARGGGWIWVFGGAVFAAAGWALGALWPLFLLPGWWAALVVRRRPRLIESLALAAPLSLVLWGFGAMFAPVVGMRGAGMATLAFSLALGLAGGNRPRVSGGGPAARAALLAAALGAVPVGLAYAASGHATDGGYRAAYWFAGDGFYAMAMAERWLVEGRYPRVNPFLAGAENQYMSLFHGALANLAALSSQPVPSVAGSVGPVVHLCGFAMLALAAAGLAPGRTAARRAAGGLVAAAAYGALRPDLLIYPQTNAFAAPVLFALWWMLGPRPHVLGRKRWALATLLLFALLLGHLVSAAVGLASLAAAGTRASRQTQPLVLVFFLAGGALFLRTSQLPHGGGGELWRLLAVPWAELWPALRPWLAPAAVSLACFGAVRGRWTPRAAVLCAGLFAAYLASGFMQPGASWPRAFTLFNAERFAHAAAFLGLLGLSALPARRFAMGAAALGAGVLLLPTAVGGGVRVLFGPPVVQLGPAALESLAFARRELPPSAAVAVWPPSYAFPAFTGRAQLPVEEPNLWGLGTISEEDFAARLRAAERLAAGPGADPDAWHAALVQSGATHLWLRGTEAELAARRPPEGRALWGPRDGVALYELPARLVSARSQSTVRRRPSSNSTSGS
ncbi:MAG: hypothetical protein SF028_07340 [Candidatus Sumerlaeia bacterium]|nr:hypothetical protein [Candidatus Sumerlaeia bacterium]